MTLRRGTKGEVEEKKRPVGLDADGNRRPYLEIRSEQRADVRRELSDRFGDNHRIDPLEDPIAWRRAIRVNPIGALVWRTLVFLVGLAIILVGIPMVPLTGPGWVVIFIGLLVWSTEFMWARRVMLFVKGEVQAFNHWAVVLPLKLKVPMVIGSIIFGWLCMWAVFWVTGVPGWFPEIAREWLTKLPGVS